MGEEVTRGSSFCTPIVGHRAGFLSMQAVITYFVRDVDAWISTRGLPAGTPLGTNRVKGGIDSGRPIGSSIEGIMSDPSKESSARPLCDGCSIGREKESSVTSISKKSEEEGKQTSSKNSATRGDYVTFRSDCNGSSRRPAFGMWPLALHVEHGEECREGFGITGRQKPPEDCDKGGKCGSFECCHRDGSSPSSAAKLLPEQRRRSVDSSGGVGPCGGMLRKKQGEFQGDGCLTDLSLFWSAVARAIDTALLTPLAGSAAADSGPEYFGPDSEDTKLSETQGDMADSSTPSASKRRVGRSRTYTEVVKSDTSIRDTGRGFQTKREASGDGVGRKAETPDSAQGRTTRGQKMTSKECRAQCVDVASLLQSGRLSLEEVLAALAATEEEVVNRGLSSARSTFRENLSILMRRE